MPFAIAVKDIPMNMIYSHVKNAFRSESFAEIKLPSIYEDKGQ